MLVKLIESNPAFVLEDTLLGRFILLNKLPTTIVFRSIDSNISIPNPNNESLKIVIGRMNRFLYPYDQYYMLTESMSMPGYLCTAIAKIESLAEDSVGIWIRGDRHRLCTITCDVDELIRRVLLLRYRFGVTDQLETPVAIICPPTPRMIVSARPPPPPVLTRQDDVVPAKKRKA